MTTFMSRAEVEVAPLLGLPPGFALAATIFLGRPERQLTKLRRRAISEFVTRERFDGEPFQP